MPFFKETNKYIIEYCFDYRIIVREYELVWLFKLCNDKDETQFRQSQITVYLLLNNFYLINLIVL